jgi:TolA-binding protein
MKPACPRQFEAEAWRDGRLQGAEVARFQAHASTCTSCKQELQSLEALGEALRAPTAAEADELHVRRERTRLLAAFDAQLVPPARPARPLVWLAATLAALALVGVFFALRPVAPKSTAPVASTAPRPPDAILVQADSSARWSRQTHAERETIVLESGELSIKVDHAASPRRLLVVLPDGELEDIGTTFSVAANAGKTTRVSVQEGSVILRLRGQPALALTAGELWSPSVAAAPSNSAPSAASTSSAPSPTPNLTWEPNPISHAAEGPAESSPPSVAAPASAAAPPSAPDPAAAFRTAMAALDRGDNNQAATLFNAFVAAHPRDSRAEDALYLRVIALQRTGNAAATERAASDYLRHYPSGFRKAEIESLAGKR